jgi:hypothetical protein
MAPFRDTWHLLNNFWTKGSKIAIFLIGAKIATFRNLRGEKCRKYALLSPMFREICSFDPLIMKRKFEHDRNDKGKI